MSQGYYPSTNDGALAWLTNYKAQIPVQGLVVGLTPAQITAELSNVQKLIDVLVDIEAKKFALKGSVLAFKTAQETQLAPLKVEIARYKKSATFTPAIGGVLGVLGTATDFDQDAYKCECTAAVIGNVVRIKFVKAGVDGVNIYHRLKGATVWNFLARDTKSPYDDHIVLAPSGQPEHWEYRLHGVIDDVEIGLPSDILEVVFGG